MNQLLKDNLAAIHKICESHKVKQFFVFGSALSEVFTSNSDVDFLVEFEDFDVLMYYENYLSLIYSLERLLGRPVDLIEVQNLTNPVLKLSIDRKKELIYG